MNQWMLVEDEPDVYEVLMQLAGLLDAEGVAFTTGEEAIDWVDDYDRGLFTLDAPSLAIIDIRLPNTMQGFDVSARLRQSPHLNTIPIILSTAYSLSARQERSILQKSGADLLLYKTRSPMTTKKVPEYLETIRKNRAKKMKVS